MPTLGNAFTEDNLKHAVNVKEIAAMFDRAEALANTAKAIKGLKALDDDALETLYSEAKAERRKRKQDAEAAEKRDAFNARVKAVLDKRYTPEEQKRIDEEDWERDNWGKIVRAVQEELRLWDETPESMKTFSDDPMNK